MKNPFKQKWAEMQKQAGDNPWVRHLMDINFELNSISAELMQAGSIAEMRRLNREKGSRVRERDLINSME